MYLITRAWRLMRTRLVWGWRFHSIGARSVLGRCRMVRGPQSISIGHHTSIGADWSLADLKPGTHNSPKIRIGSHCSILHEFQCNATVSVQIGDYVLIAPRVFITDSDHIVDPTGEPTTLCAEFKSSPVIVEHDCWIGVNAVILKGVKVGHHAIIGANAVVTRDVEPCTTVAGIPARAVSRPTGRLGSSKQAEHAVPRV